MTEKDYCDYDTCVALEELGYPRYCYDNGGELDKILRMVTLYNAHKWLREEKKIHIEVLYQPATWTCKIYKLTTYEYIKGYTFFNSYEETLLEGIKEAIKILKEE